MGGREVREGKREASSDMGGDGGEAQSFGNLKVGVQQWERGNWN